MPAVSTEKMYYTIGEVATMFDVNVSLIRFWEKEFDIIKPTKNKKGNRLFTPDDVENFHLIYHLVKERGMKLMGAKLKLQTHRDETMNNFEIVKRLKNIKQQIIDIRDEFDSLTTAKEEEV